MDGTILFTIGVGILQQHETSEFLEECKSKLREFMRDAQVYFNTNKNMEHFTRIATLR